MSALNIGLSGLLVNQRLLDLTGQNITNANTPGYHRQLANLVEAAPHAEDGLSVGTGVQITGLTRSVNQALEQAVVSNTSASNNASTQLDGLNQLQTFLATGSGTLHDALGNLFTQLETLTTEPTDPTQRQVVLSAAADVTSQLNGTEANIAQLTGSLSQQATAHVDAINGLTTQIAQLNQQIHDATISGADTNGLLDQRDQALGSLAELVDVRTLQQPYGQISIFTGGDALVMGNQAAKLGVNTNQGQLAVTSSMALHPLNVSGGQLGGVLQLYNTTLPDVRTRLDTFAQALAQQFDQIHATGVGLNGPMTSLTSLRTVTHVNQPLSAQQLGLPAQVGDLYITVTNLATGQRTLNRVTIDPKSQSLSAIAASISAVPNMQAVVDPQAGTINLLAKPGYGFDFTGNLSSVPDAQAITGTTSVSVDGQYTGTTNGSLQFSFGGSGTIGLTPNLMLQVRDSAGTLLGSVNVGQGYAPGTDLAIVLGVNVKLAAGTVNAGDSFSVNVAGNPDSANLLSALGLNTFFVGSSAADLAVNPNLMMNPQELALSTSGQPGDATNLTKLTALQTQPVLVNQTQSLQQYLENIIGDVGTQANTAQAHQSAYSSLGQQLSDQLQSVSGVDPNEELMRLVQYQQSYQMSAQFIATVKKTFDDFLAMF
jgi:flagellar hook-associated protein 1 FlgK